MMTDLVERLRVLQRQYENKMLPATAKSYGEAADEIERLRAALRAVVDAINDYERVNNLAPSPGSTECWDCVAHAKIVLGQRSEKECP